jgi:type II restriction/modification system DNA methylase subunit YeeA
MGSGLSSRPMNPAEYAAKWIGNRNTESAASHEHFIDLCQMLGEPTPNTDPDGSEYAFEKGATKTSGGDGWADVWKRGHFGWEYKGHHKDLEAAYKQLLDYREALENPPLLIVCDLDRFVVRTNFTNTIRQEHAFTLEDLRDAPGEPLRVLRAVFSDPDTLRPTRTREELTEEAAGAFAKLALDLRAAGHEPVRVAHFLNKLLFCLFAEDAGLLPARLVSEMADNLRTSPAVYEGQLRELFRLMSQTGGGSFGPLLIQWFNGGLFDGDEVLPLDRRQIELIGEVSRLDWSQIEPAVFGTLFERGLDPDKRSQLGAHYTDRRSIERIVYPVVIDPLRFEFESVKRAALKELEGVPLRGYLQGTALRARTLAIGKASARVGEFLTRLANVRVLDPACGSGNFLYVAVQALKDLEREVLVWEVTELGVRAMRSPVVGPANVHGIELNSFAAELARVVIWIGEIQWMIGNGFGYLREPVLRPLDNIERRDAILDLRPDGTAVEPRWPAADFIVGNPPFLGAKFLRGGLGSEYVDALFHVYADRLPGMSDLCCYWFEKARAQMQRGMSVRAGLLATQGIRGQFGRQVLQRIKDSGGIFRAWSDEAWTVEGAAVHVSIVCFDNGSERAHVLDDSPVGEISANLRSGADFTQAQGLTENTAICFYADVKAGSFDINATTAERMLGRPNPHGRPNSDVIVPWIIAVDITRRPRNMWIIDFGSDMPMEEAALYEAPFKHVETYVKPKRQAVRRRRYRDFWWLHAEPCAVMRRAIAPLERFIATPAVSKHRLFAWVTNPVLPDHAVVVFARDDDYFFGVLHSRVHELWARAMGTQLREVESGFRYTPTTTFETFPLPHPTAEQASAIAASALALNTLREGWLNPPGLEPTELPERTLTNLYNERPTWLAQAHERLDAAVLNAYGWESSSDDTTILARLLDLNLRRSGTSARAEATPEG